MANIERLRVAWSGWSGQPGVSTFYAVSAATLLPPLRTFFNTFVATLPVGVTLTFPSGGEVLDEGTGVVSAAWSASAPAPVVGTAGGVFASRTGAVFQWTTGTVVGRRLLRGRTFLVPISGIAYDSDGTIGGSTITAMRSAAATLIASGGTMQIWHRPPNGLTGGLAAAPSSAQVRDRVQVLTSRSQ